MSDFSLTLGPVAFAGFELPSSITFGGRQRLAIHRLPGGLRIIDALGPDPADIAFSGIFTGPDAADRARLLDTLRDRRPALPLAWDAFLYTVVLEQFEADYRSPWWIPYRLSCTVLRDEAAALVSTSWQLAPALSADLLAAGTSPPPPPSRSPRRAPPPPAPPPMPPPRPAWRHARHARHGSRRRQPGACVGRPAHRRASAGLLAQLTAARAYAARAARNLAAAST